MLRPSIGVVHWASPSAGAHFADAVKAWWFQTGTPSFLVETLMDRRLPTQSLDSMLASEELLSTFNVSEVAPEAPMFQTGYLTVLVLAVALTCPTR